MSNGFLKYGSTAPSVLIQNTLTTALTTGNMPYGVIGNAGTGTGNVTHDATLGMKALADGDGGDKSYVLSTPDSSLLALDDSGQLSLEVEPDFVTFNNPDPFPSGANSTGYVSSDLEGLIALTALAGASPSDFNLFVKSVPGTFRNTMSGANATFDYLNFDDDSALNTGLPLIHSVNKVNKEFITLNLGWWDLDTADGRFVIGIDGYPLYLGKTSDATLNGLFNQLWIGSRHSTAGRFVKTHWFRNLQVCSERPTWITASRLSQVAILSDSLYRNAGDGFQYNNTESYDNFSRYWIQRTLLNNRVKAGNIFISQNGGFGVGQSASGDLLKQEVPAVLAVNPLVAVVSGGTNDIGTTGVTYDGPTFTTAYRDLINQLMLGVAYETVPVATSIEWLVLNIPAPRFPWVGDAPREAAQIDQQTRINALPAWFNTTFPTLAGGCRVNDNFTIMGADNELAEHDVFPNNTIDDTHFASKWNTLAGQSVGARLYEISTEGVTMETFGLVLPDSVDWTSDVNLNDNLSASIPRDTVFSQTSTTGDALTTGKEVFTELKLPMRLNGSPNKNARAFLYEYDPSADSGNGLPTTLLATSEVTAITSTTAALYTFTLATPFTPPAGIDMIVLGGNPLNQPNTDNFRLMGVGIGGTLGERGFTSAAATEGTDPFQQGTVMTTRVVGWAPYTIPGIALTGPLTFDLTSDLTSDPTG